MISVAFSAKLKILPAQNCEFDCGNLMVTEQSYTALDIKTHCWSTGACTQPCLRGSATEGEVLWYCKRCQRERAACGSINFAALVWNEMSGSGHLQRKQRKRAIEKGKSTGWLSSHKGQKGSYSGKQWDWWAGAMSMRLASVHLLRRGASFQTHMHIVNTALCQSSQTKHRDISCLIPAAKYERLWPEWRWKLWRSQTFWQNSQ